MFRGTAGNRHLIKLHLPASFEAERHQICGRHAERQQAGKQAVKELDSQISMDSLFPEGPNLLLARWLRSGHTPEFIYWSLSFEL